MSTTETAVQSKEHDLDQLTALFRLLSDRTRLNILLLLAEGERNVTSLCDALQLPQPTVSHHLGLLRMNKIINNRRSGKQVFYGLNGSVEAMKDSLLQISAPSYDVRIVTKDASSDAAAE
jgi:DNA-binding transcriptional ArsR family regulator